MKVCNCAFYLDILFISDSRHIYPRHIRLSLSTVLITDSSVLLFCRISVFLTHIYRDLRVFSLQILVYVIRRTYTVLNQGHPLFASRVLVYTQFAPHTAPTGITEIRHLLSPTRRHKRMRTSADATYIYYSK